VIVTPTPEHQIELRERIGLLAVDEGKADRLADTVGPRFRPVDRITVRRSMRLTRDDVDRLIRMGPSAYHLPDDRRRAAVAALADVTEVTLAVTISVFATPD
jgi:23S rRNA (guanine745-N1)-methyltransferase